MKKLLICGSAAAEAVPGLFCTCPLCLKALKDGGKDVRSRTAYQIGDEIRVDFGPDLFYHAVKYGLRYDKLRDLVITHNHRDHFCPEELVYAAYTYPDVQIITYYTPYLPPIEDVPVS